MELKLTGIRKHFGEKEVLRGCGFTFQQGKIYGLLGRNGAGKTTLFNCLTDEVPPDGGTAELVLDDGTRRALAPDDVGYVFATPILPDFLTGYEFVRFYMDVIARPPVILLDEPLTSFDVVVALEIKQLLRQIKHEHIIVFSTHILQLATDLCDEIAVLHEGMLSQLDHALLHSGDFEAQLIELLKDEGEA